VVGKKKFVLRAEKNVEKEKSGFGGFRPVLNVQTCSVSKISPVQRENPGMFWGVERFSRKSDVMISSSGPVLLPAGKKQYCRMLRCFFGEGCHGLLAGDVRKKRR